MKKMNNKGFSLVEILTALAVGSIILLGVVAFMNGSSVTYKTTTTQIALQDDCQEALNYLNDLTQIGMDMVFLSSAGTNPDVLYIFGPKKESTEKYQVSYVVYNKKTQSLYVSSEGITSTEYNTTMKLNATQANDICQQENLLCEGIVNFDVNIEREPDDEVSLVDLTIGVVKNNAVRNASISVRPRNRDWTYGDGTAKRFFDVVK